MNYMEMITSQHEEITLIQYNGQGFTYRRIFNACS